MNVHIYHENSIKEETLPSVFIVECALKRTHRKALNWIFSLDFTIEAEYVFITIFMTYLV